MAGEDATAAASAGTEALQNPPKKEEEDEDDEDNAPLSVSRGRKKAGGGAVSKPKKEEESDDEDNIPLARSRAKKAMISTVKKEEDEEEEVEEEEEEEEEDDDFMPTPRSQAKKGSVKQKSTVNSKAKTSKVKKEETDSDDDSKLKSLKKSTKTPKIKKTKDEAFEYDTKEEKKIKKVGIKVDKKTAAGDKVKKERKVYELPGQKHDPPPERDPLRIFYESLYEQVPSSDMAATWLMEWGLLPPDEAREVLRKKQGQKLKSPVKTVSTQRKTSTPTKNQPRLAKETKSAAKDTGKTTAQKKRRAASDTDDDNDDFVLSKTKTKRQKISS